MKAVHSPLHRLHDPATETYLGLPIPANESGERAERIREVLASDPAFDLVPPTPHGTGPITAVHDPALLRFLEEAWPALERDGLLRPALIPEMFDVRGLREGMGAGREPRAVAGRAARFALDTSTPIVAGTYAAARAAVDVALTTLDLVLAGESAAYGLCRPPGHHAARSMYGGYCYFNNAAIAAEAFVGATGEPVAILDVDYHHGNGTQQIFWRRGDVAYASLHADPSRMYPFIVGYADEVGAGQGAGANLNVPLPAHTTDERYLAALDEALDWLGGRPGSLVVVSLGFDTYVDDPLGDFELTTPAYHEMGRRVASLERRLVILQEGGYHRPSLGSNARAWLRGAAGLPPA